jgi:hypothetical protein
MNNHTTQSQTAECYKTSQYTLSLLYKIKRIIFTSLPNLTESQKENFLTIINEKDVDSEKISEFLINLKSVWSEVVDIMLLSNDEICEHILYSLEYVNRKSIFNIEFSSLFNQLIKKSKDIPAAEELFYSKYTKPYKKLNEITWLNFNSQRVLSQLKRTSFMDILLYEKDIFVDKSIYMKINSSSSDLFELLQIFLLNRKEVMRIQVYISDEIQAKTEENLNDFLDNILETVLIQLGNSTILSYFSLIINNNLKHTISDKNFILLKSIIKRNKPCIEILKIEGVLFSPEQKQAILSSIIEYTYFDNLKIVNSDIGFSEEQMEKLETYFKTSKNHVYYLINEIELTNLI